MKKKKRKRDEIDYNDPNQRVNPPSGANPGNISRPLAIKRSKQNQACPICRGTHFEWGLLNPINNYLRYKLDSEPTGKSVRTRRCLTCDNLQFFINS